jgi:AraC-like DNA-binding protein
VSRSANALDPTFGVDHLRRIDHLGHEFASPPYDALTATVDNVDPVQARSTLPDTEVMRLLADYASLIRRMPASKTPELRQLVATHVHDVMALALGATRDAAEVANGCGLGAARLAAIKADILARLGARDLSLDAVAKRQGISPIYVRKLFEGEDTSFTQFVLGERLARVHRLLRDPRLADRSIAALALEAGFGDLSYFNRAFRRRYRVTPSDVRPNSRPIPGFTRS